MISGSQYLRLWRGVRYTFVLLVLLLTGRALYGQNYSIQVNRYGPDTGLETRYLKSLQEDHEGVVWALTEQQLLRFDGHSFQPLADGVFSHMIFDHQHRLWVSGKDGLFYFDTGSQALIQDLAYDWGADAMLDVFGDDLWLTSKNTLIRYRPGTQPEPIFDLQKIPGYAGQWFLSLTVESEERIWLLMRDLGQVSVNSRGELLEFSPFIYEEADLTAVPDGKVWQAENGILFSRNRGDKTSRRESPEKMDESYRAEYEQGAIVISSDPDPESIWVEQIPKQTLTSDLWFFSQIREDLYRKDSSGLWYSFDLEALDLAEPILRLRDSRGVLWFSTLEDIVTVSITEAPVKQLLSNGTGREKRVISTRGIYPYEGGGLLVNSYAGLFRIGERDEVSKWPVMKAYIDGWHQVVDPEVLPLYAGLSEPGVLWFTSDSQGIYKYSVEDDLLTRFDLEGIAFVHDLLRVSDGSLWVAKSGGLGKVDEQNSALNSTLPGDHLLAEHWVRDMAPSEAPDQVWVASNLGVYLVDLAQREVLQSFEGLAGIDRPEVFAVHLDSRGQVWAGTKGHGLFCIRPDTREVSQFTKASHGLSDDRVISILQENDSVLWLGSFNGLMRFDTNEQSVRSFFKDNGFSTSEFNHGSAYRAADGRMYFGSINGVNAFYPQQLVPADSSSRVICSSLKMNDPGTGSLVPAQPSEVWPEGLSLGSTQDFFTVDFFLNDYRNPDGNVFAYKLEGRDEEWIDLGKQNSLRLTKPAPGTYRLLIRGRGASGQWTADPLMIPVIVPMPLIQRPEFIIAMVVVLALLVYGLILWRTQSLNRLNIRLEGLVKERTQQISEQKAQLQEQADQLKKLDELKSRFFANISHELRTPLTLILGHMGQLIGRTDRKQEEVEEGLHSTRKNARGLLGLIDEIMDLTRLEAGKLSLEEQEVRLKVFLKRVASVYETAARQKGLSFYTEFSMNEALAVTLDVAKTEKILNNLLSNAFKFTDKKGTVHLTAELKDGELCIRVADSGRGIHPADLPHIFERFYQSNQVGAPAEGGAGIGLSLTHELVQLMKGQIKAESQLGKGTTFTLRIPLTVVELAKDGSPNEPEVAVLAVEEGPQEIITNDFEKPVILLVEDHFEMRQFIKKVLMKEYRVLESANGLEALEQLRKSHVDLVVSDFMMPEMDGLQLLKHIKELETLKNLPVILLTARAAIDDKLTALSIGVDEYMLKPFDPAELRVRVANLLSFHKERLHWLEETGQEEQLAVSEEDEFMRKAYKAVLDRLADTSFGVIDLAEAANTSQRSLSRKLKTYSGLSPLQYITEVRLQEARKRLEQERNVVVSEIMLAVGFQSGGHFSRTFHKRFGKTPSEYANQDL